MILHIYDQTMTLKIYNSNVTGCRIGSGNLAPVAKSTSPNLSVGLPVIYQTCEPYFIPYITEYADISPIDD
jgi:hypothetical protein